MKSGLLALFIVGIYCNMTAASPPIPAQIWGLSIGIAEYDHDTLILPWADKNAVDFSHILQDRLNISKEHCRILTNHQATRENILEHFTWLNMNTKPGDRVYIFYSGYTASTSPFVPYDSHNSFSINMLKDILRENDASEIIIIVDVVEKEGKVDIGWESLQEIDKAVSFDGTAVKKNIVYLIFSNTIWNVTEQSNQRNSPFTTLLLNTINDGQKHDTNSDGLVTFYEIYQRIAGEFYQKVSLSDLTEANNIVIAQIPPSERKQQSMSSFTKTALGLSAAAVLGWGIALASNEDNLDVSFTGVYKRQTIDDLMLSTEIYEIEVTEILNLTQDGSSLSGNMTVSFNYPACCIASATVAITGTVSKKSAVITRQGDLAYCRGAGGCWLSYMVEEIVWDVTLINKGRIIKRQDGAEYIRQ